MLVDVKEAVEQVYLKRAEIKALEEEIKDLLEAIDLPVGTDAIGPFVVRVTESTRFNEALAREVLSEDDFARICKPVAQSGAAKALFPEKYEAMQKVGAKSVKVELAKED